MQLAGDSIELFLEELSDGIPDEGEPEADFKHPECATEGIMHHVILLPLIVGIAQRTYHAHITVPFLVIASTSAISSLRLIPLLLVN